MSNSSYISENYGGAHQESTDECKKSGVVLVCNKDSPITQEIPPTNNGQRPAKFFVVHAYGYFNTDNISMI